MYDENKDSRFKQTIKVDCNQRTPYTRYYFDLNAKTGYAQALYSNVKVYQYNPENMGKEIVNNPLNIINNK